MELHEPQNPQMRLGWIVLATGLLRVAAVVAALILTALVLRLGLVAARNAIQPLLDTLRHAIGG
jgi:hypothetical protein